MEHLLKQTELLDYNSIEIQSLIKNKGWKDLDSFNKILKVYNFVRNDIIFGYNINDRISASKVLQDGYGQCNTKAILFMALLRALGIQCRLHEFTIDKKLQKGVIRGIWYKLSPKNIIHTWTEVYFGNKWYNLEGLILDSKYLHSLQEINQDCTGSFCGYGVADKKFQNPVIEWKKNDTYIQKEGINHDFGLFDDPDTFFNKHEQPLNIIKKFLFRNIVRHIMNRGVRRIRKTKSL